MNNRTAKALRKTANDASRATAAMVMPDFAALVRANHELAQQLETLQTAVDTVNMRTRWIDSFRNRTFSGRLRWLLRGR